MTYLHLPVTETCKMPRRLTPRTGLRYTRFLESVTAFVIAARL